MVQLHLPPHHNGAQQETLWMMHHISSAMSRSCHHFEGRWTDACGRIQVHFGMSGAFKVLTLPGREATPTTRLTLVNKDLNLVAHLSAMTVLQGDLGEPQNLCVP